jgi:hypothetical protein
MADTVVPPQVVTYVQAVTHACIQARVLLFRLKNDTSLLGQGQQTFIEVLNRQFICEDIRAGPF